MNDTVDTTPGTYSFEKVFAANGHKIRGIKCRNGRYYARMRFPGKRNATWVTLTDQDGQEVTSRAEAVKARSLLVQRRDKGEKPTPRITPQFVEFKGDYLEWAKHNKAAKTIEVEEWALKNWAKHFGTLRLADITPSSIMDYLQSRKDEDEVTNRTANFELVVLRNCLKFAVKNNYLRQEMLPTRDIHNYKHKARKRELLTINGSCTPEDTINAIAAEATRNQPNEQTQFLRSVMIQYRAQESGQNCAKKGQVDWKKAFAEHPEWKEKLGATTPQGIQCLYVRSAYLAAHPDAGQAEPVYKKTD